MNEWWRYENLKSYYPYDWSPAVKGNHPDDNIDFHLDLGSGKLPKGRLTIDRHGEADLLIDLNLLAPSDWDHAPTVDLYNKVKRTGVLPFPDNSIESIISHHCSPPNEPILTTEGYKYIGDLTGDEKLASYQNVLTWGGGSGCYRTPINERGFPFKIANRDYMGKMLKFVTDSSETHVTPNHIMLTRFKKEFFDMYSVYLMKRGDWWRIGVTTNARTGAGSTSGLLTRRAKEKAEAVWILGVFDNKKDACLEEIRLQAQFGITGCVFEPGGTASFSQEEIYDIHNYLSIDSEQRAERLLDEFGLLKDYPLISTGTFRSGFAFNTSAANVAHLQDWLEIPTASESFENMEVGSDSPIWKDFKSIPYHYEGKVYSLDVPPHHHYVSGGAVVHNCLEHIGEGFIPLMDECYRVLKPGGIFRIIVPLFPSLSAVSDPEHVRYFTKDTFESFCGTDNYFWSDSFAEPYTKARFKLVDKNYTPAVKYDRLVNIDQLFEEPREIRVTLKK